MLLIKKIKREFSFELWLFSVLLIFSLWLFWSTFAINFSGSKIFTDNKLLSSDLAFHLPLIKSFSEGQNYQFENPLFSGERLRYHFLFYGVVGLLELIGIRIDFALNSLSVIGFALLLIAIYSIAKLLFKSRSVGVLAIILFLFNGSLSFVEFFKLHPLSLTTPLDIIKNQNFPSFSPYDGKIVSAFWNLNVYTNQRHLALAYALLLFAVLIFLYKINKGQDFPLKKAFFLGLLFSLMPLLHGGVFIMTFLVFSSLFVLFPNYKRPILLFLTTALVLGLPWVIFLKSGSVSNLYFFKPGYLIFSDLHLVSFIKYWVFNLGFGVFLMVFGFIRSNLFAKKLFLAFLSLFIVANLFQFSIEMASNHKFFNLWLIVGNIFIAYVLVLMWRDKFLRLFLPVVILLLTLSGIIDFFAIKNDRFFAANTKNPDILWISQNTKPSSRFVNSSFIYHPASMAGRRIFLGWPYFMWSWGYDTRTRYAAIRKIYSGENLTDICKILTENKIDYITTHKPVPHNEFSINYQFFENNFPVVYKNPSNANFTIYKVNGRCNN